MLLCQIIGMNLMLNNHTIDSPYLHLTPHKVACFPLWPENKLQLEAHIDVRNDRKKKARGKKITGLQVGTF
jgi:hypothetical protein